MPFSIARPAGTKVSLCTKPRSLDEGRPSSVSNVKRLLLRNGNLLAQGKKPVQKETSCQPKEISRSRNKTNDGAVIEYDILCHGKVDADYIIPDKASDPVLLLVDRNGDGKPDVIYFDFKHKGKWDLSFWDTKFSGNWDLVGYHADRTLKPTSYESYETFKTRVANR